MIRTLSVCCVALFVSQSYAATITVSPGQSLQQAVDQAQPGDTVLVLPGTYGAVKSTRSGTASAPIRFVSQTPGAAHITGSDFILWSTAGDYVRIDGFDLKGVGGQAIGDGEGQAGIVNYGSHVQLVHNRVHGLRAGDCWAHSRHEGSAILTGITSIPASDITVDSNVLYDNGGGAANACPSIGRGPHGIYAVWPGRVTNNVVYNNRGQGITAWHAPSDLLIANNLVYHNGWSGIEIGGHEAPAHDIQVRHNLVYDNGAHGIAELGWLGANNVFADNLTFGNGRDNIALRTGTAIGTIEADPQFANYQADGSGDYHLKASSPMAGFVLGDGADWSTFVPPLPQPLNLRLVVVP